MSSVDLSEPPVLLVFEEVELPCFLNSLEALVHVGLLRVDDARHFRKLLRLHLDLGLGLLHHFRPPLERFPELNQLVQQLVMLFFFLAELVVEVLVQFLLVLFLLDEVLDLGVTIPLQLGDQPFLIRLLLGFVLLLQVLIGLVSCLLLLVKFLLGFLQVLASIVQLFNLYVQEGVINVHDLDLLHVLVGLEDQVLQLFHGHVLLVSFLAHFLQVLQLSLLVLHELLNHSEVALVPTVIERIEHPALLKDHGLPVALFFLPLNRLTILAGVLLESNALTERLLRLLLRLILLLLESCLVLLAVIVQLILMILHCLDLRIENELLTDDLQPLLGLVLRPLLEALSHIHVLFFQELDVLVRRLLVVEQRANAGVLFIFDYFFLKNSELELHEVHLLLQDL